MNPVIRQLLGEHEIEGGKLRPEAVMYLAPDQVDSEEGCHCGKCLFFNRETSECLLTEPAKCDAESGVCGLYIGGPEPITDHTPKKRVPKTMAGYVTDGPTHCANCEYFIKEGKGGCEKVGGHIYAKGCCSGWEPGDGNE